MGVTVEAIIVYRGHAYHMKPIRTALTPIPYGIASFKVIVLQCILNL